MRKGVNLLLVLNLDVTDTLQGRPCNLPYSREIVWRKEDSTRVLQVDAQGQCACRGGLG